MTPSVAASSDGAASNTPTVCVATHSYEKYSETFIRAHIERLPLPTIVLTGRKLDQAGDGEQLGVITRRKARRAQLRHRVRDVRRLVFLDDVAAYFDAHHVGVVLAEYGTAGVDVLEHCAHASMPLVVHFHGYDASRRTHLDRYAERYRTMFEQAAAIVSVSHDMTSRLIELGAPAEKINHIPYGVDLDAFGGASPAEQPPVFLSVGRFVEKKAPHLLLLAFERVLSTCPDARLVMVGDGVLLPIARQLADTLGIGGAVATPGSLPSREIASLMREARCFVQHSIRASDGDAEGAPVAIMEAAASGLPVVATRHAGIVESVRDGESGLLVDEFDVAGMAEAMVGLARDPDRAGRMGARGRQLMASDFDRRVQLDRLAGVLCSAANG